MNKPFCILVDDEEASLRSLKNKIEELDLLEIEASFLDPDKFLVEIDRLKASIIFLDMEMPIMGDEIASKLEDKLVIFVSGHNELAYKAYNVNAVDFVQKPVRVSRLKEAIKKVLLQVDTKKLPVIVVKSQGSKKEEINAANILDIRSSENDSRDKEFRLLNGSTIVAKNINFKELTNQLPTHFLKVNPSQIVNVNHAKQLINADTIGLKHQGGIIEVNLGDSYKEAFFESKPHFK